MNVRVVDFYAEFPAPEYKPTPGTMWQASDGHWIMCCPICGDTAGMSLHKITIQDGRPTASPSVVCPTSTAQEIVNGKLERVTRGGCHYWLRNGEVILA